MNFYAEQLRTGRNDVPVEVRYAILCQMIANDPEDTKEDLVALTNEYKNLKGSVGIEKSKTEFTIA
ncbi:hypothetical protein [Halobacillus litoralis]|uniref:Uncharacterized protein n=1 Tax=Halobacillus litoralis TaxID=45668 RepID=A0A410MDT3_9BACI|nr:hypothetical protein [Halobacillus litoralis]QAS52835.1 hypothetical protein HLI_11825 [Halobacillus litoralis]